MRGKHVQPKETWGLVKYIDRVSSFLMWQFKGSFTNVTGLGEFCFQLEFSESKVAFPCHFPVLIFWSYIDIKDSFFFEDGKEISHHLSSSASASAPGHPQSRGSPSISAPKSYDGGLGAPNEWTGRKVSGFLLRKPPLVVDVEFRCYVMLCDVMR